MGRLAVVFLLALLLFVLGAGLAASAGAIPIIKNITPSPLRVWAAAADGETLGVAAAPNGVGYACGFEERVGHGVDVVVHRVGSGEWTKYLDGTSHGTDKAYDVAVSPAGAVYVAAGLSRSAAASSAVLIKYSPSGKRLWTKQWAGVSSAGASARRLVITSKGEIVIAGVATVKGASHVFAAKYSPAGKRLWARVSSRGASQVCTDACLGGGDSVYVTGQFEATDTSDTDGLVARFTAQGKLAWVRTYDAVGAWDGFRSVCKRPAGGVYVAGTSETDGDDYDGILVRYSGSGAPKVVVRVGASDNAYTEFYAVVRTTDGRLAVCGGHSVGAGLSSMVVASYTDAGVEKWYRTWSSASGSSSARLLAARADGGLAVAGFWGRESGVQHAMTYFVNKTGTRTARCDWVGPAPGETTPEDIAVRGSSTWVGGWCEQMITAKDGFAMRLVP